MAICYDVIAAGSFQYIKWGPILISYIRVGMKKNIRYDIYIYI